MELQVLKQGKVCFYDIVSQSVYVQRLCQKQKWALLGYLVFLAHQ